MNITYSAFGRKNSKKNPATMLLNFHLECGEVVEVKLSYEKGFGWSPVDESSARAVYLYCMYITHDHMWKNKSLQNYLNGYFNSVTSWNKQAASLNWVSAYSDWKYNENNGAKVLIWEVACY